ncbi:Hypothetical_protein [Hexamita inflata]|uniref:Hypothetical_protein n=1 Tax=Hexamita inflata TaxID=28002 RepID=A0AA86QUI1_9EUKA|nr:Hypothetical protein HINF_LOCUS53916 [Hexamita inflata]CAI9970595.1 Hypothetical protein HINF_LOCUS58240 [Hexamita inflata]
MDLFQFNLCTHDNPYKKLFSIYNTKLQLNVIEITFILKVISENYLEPGETCNLRTFSVKNFCKTLRPDRRQNKRYWAFLMRLLGSIRSIRSRRIDVALIKLLNDNQKPKGNSFTGQQNHNSSTKQRATTDQNPYIYIKQCEMNNCFDRKQQNKNNDAYKKNWQKHSWNQADVVQKLTKVLQKTLKQQGNYFDRNNNKFNNNQGKLFNSLNEYRYDDVKSKRNDDSFMYVKIPIGQNNFSKQNKGGNKSFGGYKQGNFNQKFI